MSGTVCRRRPRSTICVRGTSGQAAMRRVRGYRCTPATFCKCGHRSQRAVRRHSGALAGQSTPRGRASSVPEPAAIARAEAGLVQVDAATADAHTETHTHSLSISRQVVQHSQSFRRSTSAETEPIEEACYMFGVRDSSYVHGHPPTGNGLPHDVYARAA